ncbi:hypothetical protein TWF730_002917 [Orbilia blumenaviensis]|uniref:Uncharacterized protein n=1 Tax=Orbilia blumenaviensis TaxID=1796055 RepID=A0AAV9U7G9_9PEZI
MTQAGLLLFFPLLVYSESFLGPWGCQEDIVPTSTTTITSFVTLSGTVTSFYECLSGLPFCDRVVFQNNAISPTTSEDSRPTAVPAVGQPVTLSVTGSDGVPLAAELSSDGQLLLVDASTATNATVLFTDDDGFLRVYNSPSLVLFLGTWTRAERFRRRQSTDGISQIQYDSQSDLTADDKAGNFSFGAAGGVSLNVDGVDNNFYKSGTTGQTQLYAADEGVDPGFEFDGVSVIPVVQEDLPIVSFGSGSAIASATSTASSRAGSASNTGVDTTSNSSGQETIATPTSGPVPTSSQATGRTSTGGDTTLNPESSTSASAEDSSTQDSSSSTSFNGLCPTDSANPTVFATITGDGYEAVTDIISVGGAFYTCWCSSILNLFGPTRTELRTSSVFNGFTSTTKVIFTKEEISTVMSQTGVVPATTTSYLAWPARTRRRAARQATVSTPDALTRFAASNITAGCNLMVSYPVQSTVEKTTVITISTEKLFLKETTTTESKTTTEFYMSTSVEVIVATPSSFSATLGWRKASGGLTYLEGNTISSGAFELITTNAPAGQLLLDTTGRLVYSRTNPATSLVEDFYAAAPAVSDATTPTAVALKFALEATIIANDWQYIGFFPDRNTIIIDSSQSAGGYKNFGLCTFLGATPAENVDKLVIMIGDTKPDGASYCDFRSYLNFQ